MGEKAERTVHKKRYFKRGNVLVIQPSPSRIIATFHFTSSLPFHLYLDPRDGTAGGGINAYIQTPPSLSLPPSDSSTPRCLVNRNHLDTWAQLARAVAKVVERSKQYLAQVQEKLILDAVARGLELSLLRLLRLLILLLELLRPLLRYRIRQGGTPMTGLRVRATEGSQVPLGWGGGCPTTASLPVAQNAIAYLRVAATAAAAAAATIDGSPLHTVLLAAAVRRILSLCPDGRVLHEAGREIKNVKEQRDIDSGTLVYLHGSWGLPGGHVRCQLAQRLGLSFGYVSKMKSQGTSSEGGVK